ncbi:MAG: UDP-N-acetylmuramoyl-L-alanine--D-glutamate ligase [Bryobacteraceae bacterium]|nr:UDP-N-acetylmuramoyl-L-alanine--D-glutamate ligase [Bryobacteraceae bacterium]MDW8379362.1 UDP-N-acetylmuramoyl-L-alanine--D-glutamate ligase [Bryobacterales bacterium]
MDWKGLKVLVVGLGKSGLAAIELLVEKGAQPLATDSRPLSQLPGAGLFLEQKQVPFLEQSVAFQSANWIVLSPGVPVDLPEVNQARERGAQILGEVELAGPFLRGPRIGITGSNGKTTTTAWIGHLLRESGVSCQVGGNIGWPLCAMVASSREDQWNVLELSSFQLETIRTFAVDISVTLNITPDHLDRHHSFPAYAAAKRRIVETQNSAGCWAVLNADDPTVREFASYTKARPCWFSLKQPVPFGLWFDGEWIHWVGEEGEVKWMRAEESPLPGLHNLQNLMAAAAATRLAGVSSEAIRQAAKTFPGVEHRMEFVREVAGVRYYNDSKATNVDAAIKAIDSFAGRLWMILGGKDKDSDYRPLRQPLQEKARGVLLIGSAAEKIASQLEGAVPVIRCGTLEEAVRQASRQASSGDIVLLSPACASFDQFQNFEERGKMFKTFVSQIVSGSEASSGLE